MRQTKLGWLLCSTLLACSGRYVSNSHDAGGEPAVGTGAVGAGGGKAVGAGGNGATPSVVGGAAGTGGTTSSAGAPVSDGAGLEMLGDTGCGVALGMPAPLDGAITNTMMWWFRVSKLIWGAQGHAAPDLPSSITYEQAGKLADAAMDQAIDETKGIPGVEPFLRSWLRIETSTEPLLVDWNSALSRGPALAALLGTRLDATRVGSFTEPAFLAEQPSASWRGMVMAEALFSQQVPPEPPGIQHPPPPSGVTRREALAAAVVNPVCAGCHQFIDPLGWSLENYDEYGQYVTVDAGKPVDASGSYTVPGSNTPLQFQNIEDLGRQLTGTCAANLGLADRFLAYALEQSQLAQPLLGTILDLEDARLRQAFIRSGVTYRSLVKAFAQSQAIRAD